MRQTVIRRRSKRSLFWRYFFLLAAVGAVFLAAFTMSARQFTVTLRTTYLEQAQHSFEKNAQLLERDMALINSLPVSMEDNPNYTQTARATLPLETQQIFSLAPLNKSFQLQCLLLDLPAEGFVYFRSNQVCLTRHRVFTQGNDCFDTYLIYGDAQPEIETVLRGGELPRGFQILPAGQVLVGGREDICLTVLVQPVGKEALYGILYPVETVLERFQLHTLPEGTRFHLARTDGTTIFERTDSSGHDADYITLSCELPALGCTASIGVPRAYFQNTVRTAQTAAQIIFLVSAVIGISLCFLFSHISVKPFRELIRDHTVEQMPHTSGNELEAIDSFLKTAREKNVTLRRVMLSSLLVRAFSGLTIPQEEYRKIADTFPIFNRSLRVAILRDQSADYEMEAHESAIDRLRQILPEHFLCEHINMQETIILFPSEPEFCELLHSAVLELNADEQQVRFVCGIGAPFVGVEEIGHAIRQVQRCIPEGGQSMIVHALPEENPAQDGAALFDLKPFQQALACWNQQEVLIQIEQMATYAGKNSRVRPQERFHSMLFLLREAARTGKIPFEDREKMAYLPTSSPVANLRRLKGVANELFEQKNAMQMTDRQMLCEEIVQYIKTNFSDATLCMASLAKQFCVSERFVYNAVLDTAGMNMSNLLLQCRMQEAARLLRDTQENIGSVAEKCGYPVESTFYRNFKKYYHVTPAEYKNAHGGKESL